MDRKYDTVNCFPSDFLFSLCVLSVREPFLFLPCLCLWILLCLSALPVLRFPKSFRQSLLHRSANLLINWKISSIIYCCSIRFGIITFLVYKFFEFTKSLQYFLFFQQLLNHKCRVFISIESLQYWHVE